MSLAWMCCAFSSCPWRALTTATYAWMFCPFLGCLRPALQSPPSTGTHRSIAKHCSGKQPTQPGRAGLRRHGAQQAGRPRCPFRHRKPASPRVIANPSPNSAANANLRVLVCRALLDVVRTSEGDTRSSAGPGRCGYHRQRHKGSRAQQIHGELRPRSQQIHRQVITHAVA